MWPPVTKRAWTVSCLLVAPAVFACLSSPFAQDTVAQDTDQQQRAEREFAAIATAYNNGVYAKAAEKWPEFIKKYPNFKRVDEAHFFLANSLLNLKKFDEAIAAYGALEQKFPKFAQLDAARYNRAMARFQIASAGAKAEDFQKAAEAFADVVAKHAESPLAVRAYYFQGEALYSAGDIAGAAAAYRQLVEKYPDNNLAADALYFLGVAQQDLKKYDEAAKAFDAFLKNPAYANHELVGEIRLRAGICLYELKKFAAAEQQFAAAAQVKDSPYADFALLRQGQCRLAAGEPLKAAEIFTNLLKSFPDSDHARAARLAAGKAYYEGEKYDDARRELAQLYADQQAPAQEAAEAAYYLCLTHLKQGRAAEALQIAEPAAQKFAAGEMGAYLISVKADALYDIPQRRAESIGVYEQVLQRFPGHPLCARALYMAARAALEGKDYPHAQEYAQRFLNSGDYAEHELRPQMLFIAAESLLFAGGQTDPAKRQQAESLYRELVEKHPHHERAARSILRIGWCLLENGKADETAKYLTGNLDAFTDKEQLAEAQLTIGRACAKAQRHDEALAALNKARQAAPKWQRGDEVLLESALALRQLGGSDEAKNRLNQLLSQYGQSELRPQATFALAEIFQAEGNADQAIRYFTEVTQKFGNSLLKPSALFALAAVQFNRGEFDKALAALDQLLAAASDDALRARGLYLRGVARQHLGQFEPASADLTAFLATKPPPADALEGRYALALCHVGAKKNPEAIAALRAILADSPDYQRADQVRYELGHVLFSDGQPSAAAQAFEDLATKNPASAKAAEAWFHVGQFHEQMADAEKEAAKKTAELDAAAKAFAAGLEKSPQPELREKLSYKLGDVQFQSQQYDAAATTLKKQLAEFPDGPLTGAARYLAAESLYKQNKLAEALPLFEEVAQAKTPKYLARSLYRAGECAGSLKNWPASQKHYEELIKQFPKFELTADARYGLAFALQNQNQLDRAAILYAEVVESSAGESAAKSRFMLGEIAFGKRQFDDAIFHYGAVVSGYGYKHWQGLAQFEMARCFDESGKKPQAIAALEKMLADFPQHERAADARRLLAELQK